MGDLVLPKGEYNKNTLRLWYEVSESPDCQSGINFDDQTITCRKVGVTTRSNNIFVFSFDSVGAIIDGNSPEANLHKLDLMKNKPDARLNWTMFREGSRFTLKEGIKHPFNCKTVDGWASDAWDDEDDNPTVADIEDRNDKRRIKYAESENKNENLHGKLIKKEMRTPTKTVIKSETTVLIEKDGLPSNGARRNAIPNINQNSKSKSEPSDDFVPTKKNKRSELELLIADRHSVVLPAGTPRRRKQPQFG